ncbi:hypothetical protein LSH36_684g01035 [Paralvinella palmiformis]|uniref:Uncharacterized protein n=1 Tax=Paralvinella palmiformis TaxID=53620 RepID=A0AAD9J317_9ANNE|nr:hypothetical protein LSH36_684g01035 [Paralvinella palmiformis]
MTGVNNEGFTSYEDYANYWVSIRSVGFHETENRKITKMRNVVLKHKWQIIIVISLIITLIGVTIGISRLVQLRSGSSIGETDDSTSTITPNTKEVVCVLKKLLYGEEKNDLTTSERTALDIDPFMAVNQTTNSPSILFSPLTGALSLRDGNLYILSIEVDQTFFEAPQPSDAHFYYREVASRNEMDVISCLVDDDSLSAAYVFTWVNYKILRRDERLDTFQCILAFSGTTASYLIRTYGDTLKGSFKIYDYATDKYYDKSVTADDLKGKRIINNITYTVPVVTEYPRMPDRDDCNC